MRLLGDPSLAEQRQRWRRRPSKELGTGRAAAGGGDRGGGGDGDSGTWVLDRAPADVDKEQRSTQLNRIIAEFTGDALFELGAPTSSFTAADHAWVREHATASLTEIEAATLRLITLRTSRNLSDAAARLGMSPVSPSRWLGRRKLSRCTTASSSAATVTACCTASRSPAASWRRLLPCRDSLSPRSASTARNRPSTQTSGPSVRTSFWLGPSPTAGWWT
jgi:hypothetical protein